MKFHVISVSPSCRKVLGVANHLGLEYELNELSAFSGATRAEGIVALNPNAKVPILEDRDFVLWESCAIIKYLCDISPGNNLVPEDVREQADMWRWIFWDAAHFTRALAGYFLESFVKPEFQGEASDGAVLVSRFNELRPLLAILNDRLQGCDFIMGNRITLADYAVGNFSDHQRRGRTPLDEFPNVESWFDRLETFTAWARAAPPFSVRRLIAREGFQFWPMTTNSPPDSGS